MKITIETDVLLKNDLTLDEYFILYCIYNKEYNLLFLVYNCSESVNLLNDLFKGLELKQFLKNTKGIVNQLGDLTLVYLKSKGSDLFETEKFSFLTWWNMYPIKVGTGNTLRVLKSKDPESTQGKNCKIKFDKLIKGSPEVARQMLKGLEVELQVRKRSNSMQFFQLIDTYINQKTWEKYCDLELEEEKKANYGEDI